MILLVVFLLSFIPLIAYGIGNNKNKQGKNALGYYKAGRITGYIILLFIVLCCVILLSSGGYIIYSLLFAVCAIPCYIGIRKCKAGKEKELSRSGATADNSSTSFEQSKEEKLIDPQKSDGSFIRAGQDRFCPNCGADIPDGADHCEYCETSFTQETKDNNQKPDKKRKSGNKLLIVALIMLAIVFGIIISNRSCKHEWNEATCTEPKTCSKCGETEGEPLGHRWEDATCTTPKTCAVCGETEGKPLGHSPGEWVAEDSTALGGKEVQKCKVCGETVDTRSGKRGQRKAVTVLQPDGLVMNSEEFAKHLINYLPDDYYITDITSSGFKIKGGVNVSVYYDYNNHSYKDTIGFASDYERDILYLLEYIIPAVDPDVKGKDLDKAISETESILSSKSSYPILLHTGVGCVYYNAPVVSSGGKVLMPARYKFYFATTYYLTGPRS